MPMNQTRISRQQDTSLQSNHRTKSSTHGQSQDLMNIQRTIGNKAMGSMLSVQTKLTVGPVGDSYEQEADQVGKEVADHIAASESGGSSKPDVQRTESEGEGSEEEELQMKPATDAIQRTESEEDELQMKPSAESIQRTESEEDELQMKPSAESIQRTESEEDELQMKPSADAIQRTESEEDEDELQMKPSAESIQRKGGEDEGVDASIESQIKSKQGSGSKMDVNIQAKMESAFQKDFSNVNIHNDTESTKLSASLGAEAFATGNDIFFREGRYNPDTRDGQELLGHELTHVVQQRGGK
ncbi:hypothetical protein BC351_20100 [Paenibacillus ferrarius]|uniref:eCIS core domain-containing protein n=1 Tax=Paenibacillus ferrarius TaxID=1469647 RepID=A0A1V4HPR2_9BACL|nr:DUF4157 domain-containing protein [Paenibacillus ferrarius]OPH59786.1 hypothetical protein BC351_20100 [Paenibacillus ferrarius]